MPRETLIVPIVVPSYPYLKRQLGVITHDLFDTIALLGPILDQHYAYKFSLKR